MSYPAGGDGQTLEVEEQLALDDREDGLPWLDDDGYYADEGGFDARLIWFALAGLLVIGAILLAAWWFTRDQADPQFLADGSTIAAPKEPYKYRPEDPGGREVEGTGDTAYQVAEGESQRGRLSEEGEDTPNADADEAQEASPAAPSNAAYVQIGAFTSRGDANAAWVSASNRYSAALSGMDYRVVEAEVNGATVYRLQAVAPSVEAGQAACRAIRNAGGDCYIR